MIWLRKLAQVGAFYFYVRLARAQSINMNQIGDALRTDAKYTKERFLFKELLLIAYSDNVLCCISWYICSTEQFQPPYTYTWKLKLSTHSVLMLFKHIVPDHYCYYRYYEYEIEQQEHNSDVPHHYVPGYLTRIFTDDVNH